MVTLEQCRRELGPGVVFHCEHFHVDAGTLTIQRPKVSNQISHSPSVRKRECTRENNFLCYSPATDKRPCRT